MQTNNKEIVMNSIKGGFQAFFELAQLKLRRGRDFKNMTRRQQLQAGRALFELRNIAQNPDMYFSRAATEGPWRARGAHYAAAHGVNPEWAAFYLVASPADIVRDSVDAAFWHDWQTRARFCNFCDFVKDWYYNSASNDARMQAAAARDAERIVAMTREIRKDADIMRDGRIKYYVMNSKLFNNKQR